MKAILFFLILVLVGCGDKPGGDAHFFFAGYVQELTLSDGTPCAFYQGYLVGSGITCGWRNK